MMQSGYVLLSWKVGTRQYVEAYEHRVVMGNPTGMEVHHLNHNRSDNRPENLVVIDPSEHRRLHASSVDDARVVELYAQGMSTVAVASEIGCEPSTVWRSLVRSGQEIRPASTYTRLGVDEAKLRYLAESGVSVHQIADVLGVSCRTITRRLTDMGIPPRRPGRQTKVEISRAEAALDEFRRKNERPRDEVPYIDFQLAGESL